MSFLTPHSIWCSSKTLCIPMWPFYDLTWPVVVDHVLMFVMSFFSPQIIRWSLSAWITLERQQSFISCKFYIRPLRLKAELAILNSQCFSTPWPSVPSFNPVVFLQTSLTKEAVQTTPTIGSNVEEIVLRKTRFLVWDIGGQESLRASWSSYYCNTEVGCWHMVLLDISDWKCTVYTTVCLSSVR